MGHLPPTSHFSVILERQTLKSPLLNLLDKLKESMYPWAVTCHSHLLQILEEYILLSFLFRVNAVRPVNHLARNLFEES